VRLDRVTIAHLEDFVRLMQRKTHGKEQKPYSASTINTCLHLIRTILKHAWRRRILTDYPLREKLPLLPEPIVQNELTTDERDAFLASFDNQHGFRSHFTTTALARRKDRKHQPPNAQSDFATFSFERLRWSKPLFVLALYTGLRRSDLRLPKWGKRRSQRRRHSTRDAEDEAPRAPPYRPEGPGSARRLPQANGDERVRPPHA
jgi:hypothetical protein